MDNGGDRAFGERRAKGERLRLCRVGGQIVTYMGARIATVGTWVTCLTVYVHAYCMDMSGTDYFLHDH